MSVNWSLSPGRRDNHATITESTTGVVACGYSWCTGDCGLPALVLTFGGNELKAYGAMVACGSVFQSWRVSWQGEKIEAVLGDTTVEQVLKRIWM